MKRGIFWAAQTARRRRGLARRAGVGVALGSLVLHFEPGALCTCVGSQVATGIA
jgi:hypothetical protein